MKEYVFTAEDGVWGNQEDMDNFCLNILKKEREQEEAERTANDIPTTCQHQVSEPVQDA